ncbi:MAG: hypothetical protein ABW133_17525 [Polyangiaceae bacterium]
MGEPRPHHPASIPAEPGLLIGAMRLMARVEDLSEDATGALHIGQHGVILLESRRICWAAAHGMEPRFAEILKRELEARNISGGHIDALWRQCRDDGARFTDTLLSAGVVSEAALRAAFFSHTVEAIAHLARWSANSEHFVPHVRGRYDARFTFAPSEIAASLGARINREVAEAALRNLQDVLVTDTSGCAFVRDVGTSMPVVIAVAGAPALCIGDMLALCGWASGLFDITGVFDSDVRIASGTWSGFGCVVAWRLKDMQCAALSKNRAGATRIVAKLDSLL